MQEKLCAGLSPWMGKVLLGQQLPRTADSRHVKHRIKTRRMFVARGRPKALGAGINSSMIRPFFALKSEG